MPELSPSLTAHNSLRHPTPTPPPSSLPHPTRAGPKFLFNAGLGSGCWRRRPHRPLLAAGLPSGRRPPAPARIRIGGLFPGISSPRPGAGGGELPVLWLCRYCPLKTTPRRSFPCPHSEAAWTCLPEFSVFNSLFKWGLHLAWNVQKEHPNSLYHGGPPLLPAAPPPPPLGLVPGACVCAYPPSQGTSKTGSVEVRVFLAPD